MVKATAKAEQKTIYTTIYTTTFNLELDLDEAQFLFDVMMKIGGSPGTSRRKHADAIRAALSKTYALKDTTGKFTDGSGSLYFKDFE